MNGTNEICAIIPARGGSKGLVDKNIRDMNGKPLIVWSIEQALSALGVNRVIVSTDSPIIASIAREAGAEVPGLRPEELAQDSTPTEPVLLHVLDNWCADTKPDAILLLQPTSPLRHNGSIDAAIEKFVNREADSLLSVCASHAFFWKNINAPEALYHFENRPRRQDILNENIQYRETGSIYLTKTELLQEKNNRLGGKIVMFEMDEMESWEIDSEIDFEIVETMMRKIQK